MKDERRLGEGRMLPLVLSMAMPLVLSMAAQAVYNIADSLFISRYSEIAFAGVSLVQPLVFMVQTIANGVGTGTSSLLSKALGEENEAKARKAVGTGWMISLILAFFFLVLLLLTAPLFVSFFTHDAVASASAVHYLRIFSLGIPAVFFASMCSFILQSHGEAKASMVVLLTGSLTNICLDPLLVFSFRLGSSGAALASVIGYLLSALIGGFYLYGKGVTASKPTLHGPSARRILYIALPAFLSMGAGSITSLVINKLVISYGVEEMVVYGMYLKMESFLFLAANGFSSALVVIAAYNYGQRTMDRVRSAYWLSALLGWSTMIIGFLFMQFSAPLLVKLFTKDPLLLERGILCFRLTSYCLLFTSINIITQGLLQGLGKGFWSLFLGYMRFFVFLIPLAFLLSHFFGVGGVYISYFAADVPTLLLDIAVYRHIRKTMLH